MIDFRYHLVSLIAVFLALAVGIVLGAGPLRDTIGDTLTGQVEDLRADREQVRAELAAAELEIDHRDTYLAESSTVLLSGVLTDRSVAVVTLPQTAPEDVELLRSALTQAGAQVTGEVALSDAWTDPDNHSFRQSFAGQLAGYIDPAPADDAAAGTVIALALGTALTGRDGEDRSEDAETLLDLLTTADAPLVAVEEELTGPADVTLLVGGPSVPLEAEDEEVTDPDRLAAYVTLAAGLAETGEGSAVVGAAVTEHDLVYAVRADEEAAQSVTTVDGVGEVPAALSAPLALAVAITGSSDHYGFEEGAESPVPARVELPERSEDEAADDTDDEDEAATEDEETDE